MTLDYKKIKRVIPQTHIPRFEERQDIVVSYEIEYDFGEAGHTGPSMSLYKYYTAIEISENQKEALFEQAKKGGFRRELIIDYNPFPTVDYEPFFSEAFEHELVRKSVANLIRMMAPFLNNPTRYFWEEMKEILILNICQMAVGEKTILLNHNDVPLFPLSPLTNPLGLLELLSFLSSVFEAKWQVGLGKCWKDPDPEDFLYPRTEPEFRARTVWQLEVFFPTAERIAKELGLAKLEKELSEDQDLDVSQSHGSSAEEEKNKLTRLRREQEILDNEMQKRGLSFELFYQQNRHLFPAKGGYRSLDQMLRRTLDAFREGKIGEEILYYEAEKALFEVWRDYYGTNALMNDFMITFATFLKRLNLCLNFHKTWEDTILYDRSFEKEAFQSGVIYEWLRDTESILHKFIKETLISEFGETEDGWWVKGVPANIRVRCQTAREQDTERFEPFAYTYLVELKEVILKNWESFRPYFEHKQKGSLKKEKHVAWLDRLNSLRNIIMHPTKRQLTREETSFILDCKKKVENLRPQINM